MYAYEAGDACAQNNKKGGSAEPKEPPWIRHCFSILAIISSDLLHIFGPLYSSLLSFFTLAPNLASYYRLVVDVMSTKVRTLPMLLAN